MFTILLILVLLPVSYGQIDQCRLSKSLHRMNLTEKYGQFKQKRLDCHGSLGSEPLVRQTGVNTLAVDGYGISKMERNMNCCFKGVDKKWPDTFKDCVKDYIEPNYELIAAHCVAPEIPGENRLIWEDLFFTIQTNKVDYKQYEGKNIPSVLIIGIDSLSRKRVHEYLPKTINYLKQQLGAIEFEGFHSYDRDHHPIFNILTGSKTSKECIDDNCLWSQFSDKNFVTAYGEDYSEFGVLKGTRKTDIDYDLTRFDRILGHRFGHGRGKPCVNTEWRTKRLLKNIVNFKSTFDKSFSIFLIRSLTRLPVALPTESDKIFENFFRKLQLDNTILIFMSDSGKITEDGDFETELESKTPFLFISLPHWTNKRDLEKNVEKIVTGLDIHATLSGLLEGNGTSEGVNLFGEISERRTCYQLRISEKVCYCPQIVRIEYKTGLPVEIALDAIQELQGVNRRSKPMELDSILHMEEHLTHTSIRDVMVQFKLKSGIIYEARAKIQPNGRYYIYYLK